MSSPGTRILFLLPYPLHKAPSQRFRVENLLPLLDEAGISYALRPFMSERTWNVLYKGGSLLQKAGGIIGGYLQRAKTVLFEAPKHSHVFIHREAAPLGPPVFEWYLKKVLRKKIIYDFDDAIWIPNTSAQNKLASGLKAFWKVGYICKWAHTIAGGNDYLCAYAKKHSDGNVVKIPTVVDTAQRYNRVKEQGDGPVTVGWTGSHSTLAYLDAIMPALTVLQEKLDFSFVVIADKEPVLPLRNWRFVPWNAVSEIDDLLLIDVGVMPLSADPWSEGKCGFKLIQYLSLGIPAVASPVGVNTSILEPGINGYLAANDEEWSSALELLIRDSGKRRDFGAAGREKMVREYSIASQRERFLGLFRS
jgi:glycosyltransferase involved in cell wall biosynthesis